MFKLIKEKLKRLLDTRKKRLAAGGLFLVALAAIGVFFYVMLGKEAKTKKVVPEKKRPEVTVIDVKESEATRANENGVIRPLQSKQGKRITCDEALAAFDDSVKAKADHATLESLLEQVEELCPEEKYHQARTSMRTIDVSTEAGIRTALNDAIERPNLNMVEVEGLFQKLKSISTSELAPSLSDYVAKVYEEIKSHEATKTNAKEAKKLQRLLRTVKNLKPDYVDDPPLQAKNVDEGFERTTDAHVDKDFKLTADAVADAEALDIMNSDTPALVTPRQDSRSNLTRKMQEALDKRNVTLKKLCELGNSLPKELQGEFNAWKSVGFKVINSPEYVAFVKKANSTSENVVVETLIASGGYLRAQGEYLSHSHKHRTDRDDVLYMHEHQAWLISVLIRFKRKGIPISNTILEWIKGEDWDQIKPFVEQELPRAEFPLWIFESPGSEYYSATALYSRVHEIRRELQSFRITYPPDLLGYWSVVENNREYEKLKYKEYKKLSELEELENKFKGTNVHTYRDEFANIYEAVHVKLIALDFLKNYESTELAEVKKKASVLGVDPENIKESKLGLFEGCPKIYNLLIIKFFASKVIDAPHVAEVLREQNDEFNKITLELSSFRECTKLATKIREGTCSITSEGKITCSVPRWNERFNDPKWLGYILFKPTNPYQSTYLRDLLSREQEIRQRYDHGKLIHMFINDVKPDFCVHPGRPTKKMHLSTKSIDFDSPQFGSNNKGYLSYIRT